MATFWLTHTLEWKKKGLYFLFILQKAYNKNTVIFRYWCSLLYLLYRRILMLQQRILSVVHDAASAPCPWSLHLKNQFPHNITEYKNMVIRWDNIWTAFQVKENLVLQHSICFSSSHWCRITSSVVMTQNNLWQQTSVFPVTSKFHFLSRHITPHCLSTILLLFIPLPCSAHKFLCPGW